MMPVLMAEESLLEANIIAYGSGSLSESDQRKFRNTLMSQMNRRRKTQKRVNAAALESMGIKVVRVGSREK